MKPEKKIQHNLLIALFLILMFSTISLSQTLKSNEQPVVIPKVIAEQIVRNILVYYFKPTSQHRVIYLSNIIYFSDELIEQSWLPKIKGIDFHLVDIRQDQHRGTPHYKFENAFGGKHSIGFGYGSGSSGWSGDTWRFRVAKQTVKIWKDKYGWGSSGDDYGGTSLPPLPNPAPPPPIIQKKKINKTFSLQLIT